MKHLLSMVKIHAPALLLSLYVFSFWILPQGWNENNSLDGSWRYALGKFRGLDLSLGRDSWFTYGPLAHWFGAPMGMEQYQPFPYYILGLFIAGIIGITFSRVLCATGIRYRFRLISVFIFPFCFIGMDGVQEVYLIIALFLLLISCCLQESADNVTIMAMVVLGACGLLYKISFGIMSLFTLVVLLAALFARRKIGGTRLLIHLAGYVTILCVLFVATSGSSDLIRYILLGLETSGRYSETMIRNMPYSPPNYIVALTYISAGSVLAWQASKKMAGRRAALCLMTVYAGLVFFLFKHGFVRADLSHMRLFYSCVTPLLALLGVVSFSGFKTKPTSERVVLCSASLILFMIYGIMLKFLPGENSPTDLAKNWLTCGIRIVAGVKGQSPEEFPAKRAFIKNSQPRLFYRLNEYGRTFGAQGRKPRITFYPWELMYFEGLEGFVLAPSPSLQLYSSGPRSRAHRMEAAYLSSENRPDIVVIGPASIDNRSPVSELTDLLPPLYSNYRVIDVVDGFILLEAAKEGISLETVVRYSETPQGKPGEFLSISIDQPMAVNSLLWRLAAIIFKSPQLNVVVTILYGNNEKAEYAVRGYLSQLQGGILFSPEGISDFFVSAFRTSAQAQDSQQRNVFTIKSAVAEVRRSPGFWNLPVFPRVVPLKVKFCTFQ